MKKWIALIGSKKYLRKLLCWQERVILLERLVCLGATHMGGMLCVIKSDSRMVVSYCVNVHMHIYSSTRVYQLVSCYNGREDDLRN